MYPLLIRALYLAAGGLVGVAFCLILTGAPATAVVLMLLALAVLSIDVRLLP